MLIYVRFGRYGRTDGQTDGRTTQNHSSEPHNIRENHKKYKFSKKTKYVFLWS